MKNDKKTNPKGTSGRDDIHSKFDSLPLDEKIASLFKMEMATISEAINYVVNDPMKVVEKIGDTISEFGAKVEKEVRNAGSTAKSGQEPKPDPGAAPRSGRKPPPPAEPGAPAV